MTLRIEAMGPDRREAFGAVWLPWLKQTMGLTPEPEDLRAMADPVAYYGASGGVALAALLDGEVVGVVAVKGLGDAGFEFCKLVVTDAARGHGVGRALVQACLDYCAEQGRPALYLQTFNRLDVALDLYRRMGFQDVAPPPQMNVLGRTEVIMARRVQRQPGA